MIKMSELIKKQNDEKQKKKTNLETDHASYVYLGLLLKRVKYIHLKKEIYFTYLLSLMIAGL